jgi:hypothetical protein
MSEVLPVQENRFVGVRVVQDKKIGFWHPLSGSEFQVQNPLQTNR